MLVRFLTPFSMSPNLSYIVAFLCLSICILGKSFRSMFQFAAWSVVQFIHWVLHFNYYLFFLYKIFLCFYVKSSCFCKILFIFFYFLKYINILLPYSLYNKFNICSLCGASFHCLVLCPDFGDFLIFDLYDFWLGAHIPWIFICGDSWGLGLKSSLSRGRACVAAEQLQVPQHNTISHLLCFRPNK